jgi:hypothetical protein
MNSVFAIRDFWTFENTPRPAVFRQTNEHSGDAIGHTFIPIELPVNGDKYRMYELILFFANFALVDPGDSNFMIYYFLLFEYIKNMN